MMEEIKSGVRVDYVLVFKLSRFGRNAADALSSLQLMQDYGTNLVCVKDGINSEVQMGKMMIAFMSAFAEMERENILVQTMAGREQKAREGKWNGGQAPYGYKLVKDEKGKGHLEIDEDEAEIVRIIFHEYTKNGKYEHFVPTFLKNVLRNPVYIGKIAYGRRRTTPVNGKRNEYCMIKQSDYDVYDGEHETIIDEATWNAAQERMAEESHPFSEAKTGGHVHLLTGMLICPVCGRKMIANVSHGKRKKDGTVGKSTYAYACKYSKKQFGPSCTFIRQFKQEYIDREVIEVIARAAYSDVFEERVRDELDNLRFEVGNSEDWMAKWKEKGIRPNVIMVDPPRKGLTESLIESATGMNPDRIVYVSCNPATLVRDIQSLIEKGYHVEGRIQPVDQFPKTAHVECVTVMEHTEK